MNDTTALLQQARQPIASLISKSRKAQKKLLKGSWQYVMLRENLKALRISFALLNKRHGETNRLTSDNLQEALGALSSMIRRTQKAQAAFSSGTPQRALQRNRLRALRIAKDMTKLELDSRNP